MQSLLLNDVPRAGEAAGFAAVVVKPFQVADLVAAVHRVVPLVLAQPTMEELQTAIIGLKDALAERDRAIERLRQQLGVCCPWWEQRWHRPH